MIFDPNHSDGRILTLVATVGSEQDARNAAIRHESAWVDIERERELRDIARIMNQRHSFSG